MSLSTLSRPSLSQAFKLAQTDEGYELAVPVLVASGYCPSCAFCGHRARLRPWEPGTYYSYAGRECSECEEFIMSGPQPEYGGGDEGISDALPGF